MQVALAGEGFIDLAIMRRLLVVAELEAGPVYWGEGRNTGKHRMAPKLRGYAVAACFGPWFVLRDLDADADCAPTLRAGLVGPADGKFCFRVAVRAAEAWLIADRVRLAGHLAMAPARLLQEADACPDPKRAIIAAAYRSRKPGIKKELLPRAGSGRSEGPGYATILEEFVRNVWVPEEAAQGSDSLRRTMRALAQLRAVPDQSGSYPAAAK